MSLPFDSFNTMDLDTVDDGIEKSLWGLLQQYEGRWDLCDTSLEWIISGTTTRYP